MIPRSSGEVRPHMRLDTWKSIAQHLGRCNRTVQRWHSEFGLPVHHLRGTSGSVYAYTDELDDWMRSRSQPKLDSHAEPHASLELVASVEANEPDCDRCPRNGARLEASALSLVSPAEKARAARLIALASKLWETVSHRNLAQIARYYRAAIDADPLNAATFAGLSLTLIAQAMWGVTSTAFAYASAQEALRCALELDPDLPEARCAEAWLKVVWSRNWEGARLGFDEVLRRQPSCTRGMNGSGVLHITEGSLDKASAMFLKTAWQCPLSAAPMALYCWSEYLAGNYAGALDQACQVRTAGNAGPVTIAVLALISIQIADPDTQIERIEALSAEFPEHDVLRGALGCVYAMQGRRQRAWEILNEMKTSTRQGVWHEPYALGLVLVGLGEKEDAVKWLEQSYRDGSLWSLGFRFDPILLTLRNDALFKDFLIRANYPEPAVNDSLASLAVY